MAQKLNLQDIILKSFVTGFNAGRQGGNGGGPLNMPEPTGVTTTDRTTIGADGQACNITVWQNASIEMGGCGASVPNGVNWQCVHTIDDCPPTQRVPQCNTLNGLNCGHNTAGNVCKSLGGCKNRKVAGRIVDAG